MSGSQHPVGYRPGGRGTRRPSARRSRFLVLAVVQVLVFGGAAVLLVLGPGEMRGAIEAFGDALTSALGAPASPPPAEEVTLESGQVVRGDVKVLSFDEVRASKGIEAALDLAIEKYPGRLRELLDAAREQGHADVVAILEGREG